MVPARVAAALVLFGALPAATAHAQSQPATRYRLMLGASLNSLHTSDADVGTFLRPGVLLRGVPRAGFGPVVDYSNYELDLTRGSQEPRLGRLRMRVPMLGYGYSLERGPLVTTFHVAAGWAFNRVDTERQVIERDGALFEARDRPLFRGGVTFTRSIGERFALVATGGGLYVEPRIALAFRDGQRTLRTETGTWRTSGLFWGVGAAYKIF
jgi:hypothetical protein